MFDGKVPHWHHFSCFWQRAAAQSTSDIDGFSSLRWEDQEKVKKAIESGGASGGQSPEVTCDPKLGHGWLSFLLGAAVMAFVCRRSGLKERSQSAEDAQRICGGVRQIEPKHLQRLRSENRKG